MRSTRSARLHPLAAAALLGCNPGTVVSLAAGSTGAGGGATTTTASSAASTASSTASTGTGGSWAAAVMVSAGADHACALTANGAVVCWGGNEHGQLGDGTTTDRHVPVQVTGLAGDDLAIAAGSGHTCAVTGGGAVRCWGWNEFGQLGDGTTTDRHEPVPVAGETDGVTSLAAGNGYSCALAQGGAVACWGITIAPGGYEPVAVALPSPALSVSVGVATGDEQACVLTMDGLVRCWGSNAEGQLGDGSTQNSATPVAVAGLLPPVAAVSAGNSYTCAIPGDSSVSCWGANFDVFGSSAAMNESSIPVAVPGFSSGVSTAYGASTISAGDTQACVVTDEGGVACWGENDRGQLGDGTTTPSTTPVTVTGDLWGVTAVSAGAGFTCAINGAGAVLCWGANGNGQLGNGSTTDSAVPVYVTGL